MHAPQRQASACVGLHCNPNPSEPRDFACVFQAAKNCQALGAPEVRTVVANLVLPKEVDKARGPACLQFMTPCLLSLGFKGPFRVTINLLPKEVDKARCSACWLHDSMLPLCSSDLVWYLAWRSAHAQHRATPA